MAYSAEYARRPPDYPCWLRRITYGQAERHLYRAVTAATPTTLTLARTSTSKPDEILLATAAAAHDRGMPLGHDIMLNQPPHSTDTATVRQFNLRPSQVRTLAENMGIMANGGLTKRAGNPSLFF
ncbi:hypothetical protein ACLK19_16120 [Escherichia coli]